MMASLEALSVSPSCLRVPAANRRRLSHHLRTIANFHTQNQVLPRRAAGQECRCALDASKKKVVGGGDSLQEKLELVRRGELTRSAGLAFLDEELKRGNDKGALSLARAMAESAVLRGFGGASQVPQRIYTLEELRLNKIDTARFLSPEDATLRGVRRTLQVGAFVGGIALWQTFGLDQYQALGAAVFFLLLGSLDQIVNGGGVEALLLDSAGRLLSSKYKDRVAQHEAGHFLISYLVGILPRDYTLSSLEAFRKDGALNVQAGTTFIDFEFQEEVKSGKLSATTLDKFTCIALAGVATEYLVYGVAEGGLGDLNQLDGLLKGLGFTQKKADSQIRWAILNTVTLLRRHKQVHGKLASAMAAGKSVGECIDFVEKELGNDI